MEDFCFDDDDDDEDERHQQRSKSKRNRLNLIGSKCSTFCGENSLRFSYGTFEEKKIRVNEINEEREVKLYCSLL